MKPEPVYNPFADEQQSRRSDGERTQPGKPADPLAPRAPKRSVARTESVHSGFVYCAVSLLAVGVGNLILLLALGQALSPSEEVDETTGRKILPHMAETRLDEMRKRYVAAGEESVFQEDQITLLRQQVEQLAVDIKQLPNGNSTNK